jgi:hypothetical protein
MNIKTREFLANTLSNSKMTVDIKTMTHKVNGKRTILDQDGTTYEVFFCTHRKLHLDNGMCDLLIKQGVLIPFESKTKGKGYAMLRKINEH